MDIGKGIDKCILKYFKKAKAVLDVFKVSSTFTFINFTVL